MPTEVRRILFIRTDRLGDVLMNLPAVHRLRQNFPKAWLAWMVDRPLAGLLAGHPELDEVFVVDGARIASSRAYRRDLMRRVRAARFDLGVASNAHKFFHWMMFRCGIPLRAGWRRKWGFLLNRARRDDKSSAHRHEIDSNLELVGLVAPKPWDGRWEFPVDEGARASVEKRLAREIASSRPVVAVHAGTSHPAKRWSLERFAEVCRRLMAGGRAEVLLIGGSEEEALSRDLAARLPEGVQDWTGALDLKELSALLGSPRVKTLLSADSGPVHVAWLHGKPVVALYAKNVPGSDPARWGPRSEGSVVIHGRMEEIGTQEVLAALEKVLR
jgi:heptosyltransferase-2